MTVQELIELLSKENPNGEVLITVNGRHLYTVSAHFRFNIELLSKENPNSEMLITVNGRQLYTVSAHFRFNVRGTEFILLSKV